MKLLLGKTDEVQEVAFCEFGEEMREGLAQHQVDLLTFGSPKADIVLNAYEQNFSHLQEALARRNFKPDFAIIVTVGYGFLLEGIEEAPFPVALLCLEWFFTAHNLHLISKRVDHLFVVLETSVEAARRITGKKPLFTSLPLLGDHFPVFHPMPDEEKTYDVTYVGNCNPWVHPERTRFLERLAMLPEHYKVFIGETTPSGAKGVRLEETNRINNQSKICINFSQPYQKAVGTRVAHTLLSGSFLLTEQMADQDDFLADGIHCAFYENGSLEEKIAYYLGHEEEREAMARRGLDLAKQGVFSFSKTLLGMLEKLKKANLARPCRKFQSLPRVRQLNQLGVHALFSKEVSMDRALVKAIGYFQEALRSGPPDPEICGNLGMAYAIWSLLGRDLSPDQKGALRKTTLDFFSQARTLAPLDVLSWFNQACFYFRERSWTEFCQVFLQITELLQVEEAELPSRFPYLVFPLAAFFEFFPFRKWQELFLQGFEGGSPTPNFFALARNYVLWNLNRWMAEFLVERGQLEGAAEHYREACEVAGDADRLWEQRGTCLSSLGRTGEARRCFEKSLEINPLNLYAARSLYGLLRQGGEKARAEALGKKYRLICDRISIFRSARQAFGPVEGCEEGQGCA